MCPADDFTDPAVTAISSHLDSMIVLSRAMAAEGMYPAIDPLSSSSILLDPTVVGEEHYRIAEEVRETIAHYRDLQDIISLLGIEELSAPDRRIVSARPPAAAVPDPAFRGDRGLHRHARPLRAARRDAQGLPRDPRRRLRHLGGEFALHGRHHRRGARNKDTQPAREARRDEAADHHPDRRRRSTSRTLSPCAPRTRAAASASCKAMPIS